MAAAVLRPPRGRRGLSAASERADETGPRDHRPDALEYEEPPLRPEPCVDGEHRRAHEVDDEIDAGSRVEYAPLCEDEAREDEQRAEKLEHLVHGNLRIE
jgi:hypothetical protein